MVLVAGGVPASTVVVCGDPAMYGVTVYFVIGLPPLLDGAFQLTVADPFPGTADTSVGAPGGVEEVGVTGISLGGSITMVLACLDPAPDYIVPIVSHLYLSEAVEEAPILWRMKTDLEHFGVGREKLPHGLLVPVHDRVRNLGLQGAKEGDRQYQ